MTEEAPEAEGTNPDAMTEPLAVPPYYFRLPPGLQVDVVCTNCGGLVMKVEDCMSIARPVTVASYHECPIPHRES